jgi:hypothetical protein
MGSGGAVGDSGVVVGEVAGQLAVGAGLGQEGLGLLLDSGDRVGAGTKRSGGSSWLASWTSASASLAGSPACWPFISFQAAMVCLVRSA